MPAAKTDLEAVYTAVCSYHAAHGYGPSVKDVQDACGISSSSVADYAIVKLVRAGRLTRDPLKARTLRPVGL